MKTLVGISTYNEIEALPRLVPDVLMQLECWRAAQIAATTAPSLGQNPARKAAPTTSLSGTSARDTVGVQLLIVDDNSPDGTGEWCRQQSRDEPRLTCVHRAGKLGLGTATLTVLRYAIEHKFDYCVTMDADLSHPPEYLEPMLRAMESPTPVDVVIGSRYVPGGAIEGWPLRRRVMSRLINSFARYWLKIKVQDTSGAYRVYRVQTLERVGLSDVKSHGYSVFEELLFHLQRAGVSFREIPITFVDRDYGKSKITIGEAIRSVWRICNLPAHGKRATGSKSNR